MSATQKRPYAHALAIAEEIVEKLRPYCERIEIAGSIRRRRPEIGDIELVALPALACDLLGYPIDGADVQRRQKRTLLDQFFARKRVELVKDGPLQKQFSYRGFQVDLFLPKTPAHWGSIVQIRTGSYDFNMWVQGERAPAVGVRFYKGLLFRRLGNRVIQTPEEADVFAALELPFIPPEDRDDGRWLAYVEEEVAHV